MSYWVDLYRKLRGAGGRTRSAHLSHAEVIKLLSQAMGQVPVSARADLESNKSWMFAANRQIGGRASRARPRLNRITRSMDRHGVGIESTTPVAVHDFLNLLNYPNPDETGLQFKWRQINQLQTIGRNFILVVPSNTEFVHPDLNFSFSLPRIDQIRLLSPDRVNPKATRGRIAGEFEYRSESGGEHTFRPAPVTAGERSKWRSDPYEYVFPVAFPGTEGYFGAQPASAARTALDTLDGLGRLNKNQLDNGVFSGVIFKLLTSTEDPDRFREMIELMHAGIMNAGGPLFLPDDRVKVDRSPTSNQDMQFKELAELARRELLGVVGASDSIVGMVESTNRAVIWGQEHLLATGTVDPLNALISEAYNAWLLPLYPGHSKNSFLQISFESAKMVDPRDRAAEQTQLYKGGLITRNEGRKEIDRPAVADGDRFVDSQQSPGPDPDPEASETPLEAQSAEAKEESGRRGPPAKRHPWRDLMAQSIKDRSGLEEELRALLVRTLSEASKRVSNVSSDEFGSKVTTLGPGHNATEFYPTTDEITDLERLQGEATQLVRSWAMNLAVSKTESSLANVSVPVQKVTEDDLTAAALRMATQLGASEGGHVATQFGGMIGRELAFVFNGIRDVGPIQFSNELSQNIEWECHEMAEVIARKCVILVERWACEEALGISRDIGMPATLEWASAPGDDDPHSELDGEPVDVTEAVWMDADCECKAVLVTN